jgi:DNA-binding PadR family transcriptional regulator
MRRKKGTLLPLEVDILVAAAEAKGAGDGWIHGFGLAKALQGDGGRLTAHGTLYKALGRLTTTGLLDDHWEDPDIALAEGRPRRRLYQINGAGLAALARARTEAEAAAVDRATRPGIAPA